MTTSQVRPFRSQVEPANDIGGIVVSIRPKMRTPKPDASAQSRVAVNASIRAASAKQIL